MNRRMARWLAWSIFGIYIASVLTTLTLIVWGGADIDQVFVVIGFGFALVGALVARREPANAVGWLLLATAVSIGLQEVGVAYLDAADGPGRLIAAWLALQLGWLYFALVLLPLVFPTGRLLSPRWRWAVWAGLGGVLMLHLGEVLHSGTLDVDSRRPVDNPLAVDGPVPEAMVGTGNVLLAAGLFLSAVALVVRLRRSRGREHVHLKLFTYVASLAATAIIVGVPALFAGSSTPDWVDAIGTIGWFSALAFILIGLPTAIGIAILRHQLYDIDIVIKRTLVYGSLTATLIATYLLIVLLLRLVLNPVIGESELAVAGSTLAVAALFRPLRSRIQAIVDRRFYRARYNAGRTLEVFAGRLRDELDLESLGTDLRGVVHETMQPAHVSLWLRSTP